MAIGRRNSAPGRRIKSPHSNAGGALIMKKSLFWGVLLVLGLVAAPCLSAYNIVFYAYGRSNAEEHPSMAGHAFVELVGYGVYGFYPAQEGSPYSPGLVRNDSSEVSYATAVIKFGISERKLEAAKRVIESWRNSPPQYILGARDCINFVYAIADAIGLRHDSYSTSGTALPVTAVRSIRE